MSSWLLAMSIMTMANRTVCRELVITYMYSPVNILARKLLKELDQFVPLLQKPTREQMFSREAVAEAYHGTGTVAQDKIVDTIGAMVEENYRIKLLVERTRKWVKSSCSVKPAIDRLYGRTGLFWTRARSTPTPTSIFGAM